MFHRILAKGIFIFAVIFGFMAMIGWAVGDIWLASTQWMLISIWMLILGVFIVLLEGDDLAELKRRTKTVSKAKTNNDHASFKVSEGNGKKKNGSKKKKNHSSFKLSEE